MYVLIVRVFTRRGRNSELLNDESSGAHSISVPQVVELQPDKLNCEVPSN